MRDWTGLDTASLPPPTAPDFHNRTRKMFGDIDYFLRDLSRGIGRIQNGEVPDGSGDQIGNNGTLTDYWFKPGISTTFLANMGSGPGAGGKISSTADADKGFINFGDTEYIDEDGKLTGFNVTAPAAAVHIQPGIFGTTTLVPSLDVSLGGNPAVRWDGYRNAAGTLIGPPVFSGCNTNDDDTSWSGTNADSGPGQNPQGFTMSGVIIPGRLWTCKVRVRTDSGTCSNSGSIEFRINDSTGTQYTATAAAGGKAADFLLDENGAPSPLTTSWRTYTFTINGSGTSSSSGQPANSVQVSVQGYNGVPGPATSLYIRCTYIEISTTGGSDVMRWNDSSTALFGKINAAGYIGVGTGSDTLGAIGTLKCDAVGTIGQIVKGFASQTASLTEWQNSSGTPLGLITADGYFSSRRLLLNGSTSGTVTLTGGTTPTSHTYILPTAQGAVSSVLQNDGAGQLSWAVGLVRLGTNTIDMKTSATTTIFTTSAGVVTRIAFAVVRDATASLVGGTSYTITGLRAAFSLATLTTVGTGLIVVRAADLVEQIEVAASTAVQLTVTTGSTAAANATIDVFGYVT